MAQLNSEQRRAVETLSGPMLVLAGAGTGKTRVVTYRIARLIRFGVNPARILAVTFTNKAAKEMQERIEKILGKKHKERPQISTFHSHCVRILRRHARLLGYPSNFVIYDAGDQESLARQVLKQVTSTRVEIKPSDLLYFISQWKSKSIRPVDALAIASDDRAELAAAAYNVYQRELKNSGALDFDDLLLLTEELFQLEREAAVEEAARFDHILVDEYQDTNQSQYRIVQRLAQQHRNLCVVGDDDQSIYAWRGAEVRHILNFKQDWPDAKIFCLEENYRSTEKILVAANRLIKFNKTRHEKELKAGRPGGDPPQVRRFADDTREAAEVVREIRRKLNQPGIEPRDFAILYRAAAQSRPLETELRKAQIPYVVLGGQSFFDRREVKDVLAFLRLIESPDDEISLRRILNVPPRGIGQKARDILVAESKNRRHSLWQVACSPPPNIGQAACKGLKRLTDTLLNAANVINPKNMVSVVRSIIEELDYRMEIERQYATEIERDSRWQAVEQLVNAVAAYISESDKPRLGEFIEQLTLGDREVNDDKEKKLDRNAVVLLTMHSSKGLEFPYVYLIGLEDGIIPHRRSINEGLEKIEEERRLCYVGMTRAQDQLFISMALERLKWGKAVASRPSPFLFEMTGQTDHPAYLRIMANYCNSADGLSSR
ncbi:MAG TPA: UvrD-helicase domain-containing protein [Pirellulaceae bacterium]|nr:UvrD-helicase domain-containing protein [Pirellulaceae bacterium]HMO93956.1 UvrD-helicase domain-containing protein [Pirellulaceae bacterium]HMP67962.1 UvrD-helicase domain-containing protein [Pirellulaceae bacterium]